MINDIVELIATSVGAASDIFLLVLDQTGTFELVLSSLLIFILCRVLLSNFTGFSDSPVFSFAASVSKSDRARKLKASKLKASKSKSRKLKGED